MMRHVVLIGLPGAGKSSVGTYAAELLRTRCVDIDALIVRRMGMTIEHIFGEFGEPRFRELERETVAAALEEPPAVIVPGGGWAAQPGVIEGVRDRAFIIYVKAPVADAAARAERGEARPLLTGASPIERMRALLAEREPFYLQAEAQVANEQRSAEATAIEVVHLAKHYAGW